MSKLSTVTERLPLLFTWAKAMLAGAVLAGTRLWAAATARPLPPWKYATLLHLFLSFEPCLGSCMAAVPSEMGPLHPQPAYNGAEAVDPSPISELAQLSTGPAVLLPEGSAP